MLARCLRRVLIRRTYAVLTPCGAQAWIKKQRKEHPLFDAVYKGTYPAYPSISNWPLSGDSGASAADVLGAAVGKCINPCKQ